MKRYMTSLCPLLAAMLLLLGCDNNVGDTKQVRQNTLTISDSPVFPYKENSSNKYTLLLSNHANSELKLDDTKLDEFVATNTSKPSIQTIKLEELVDIKACTTIAANSSCSIEIMLPKGISNGFYTFTLNYTNNKDQHYPVTKFIAFNDDIASNNGITVTNKNIEVITTNLNKFTLAVPFYLSQDFKDIQIQDLGKPIQKYNAIQCSSLTQDKAQASNVKTDKIAQYPANSSCSVIVELDSSSAEHELTLTGLKTDKQSITSKISTRTIFGDYAHLIYIGAPLLVKKDESQSVYIHNIGTTAARGIVLQQNWITGSSANALATSSQTTCSSNILDPDASCELKYVAADDKSSILEQKISYANRIFGVEPDSYFIYINSMPPTPIPKVTSIYPAEDATFNYHERPESIVVEFSAPIDSSTINETNFNVTNNTLALINPVLGHLRPNIINFVPESPFAPGAYDITLTGFANQQGTIIKSISAFYIRRPLMIEGSTIGSANINLGGETNIGSNNIPAITVNFSEELKANSVEVIILQGAACSRLPRESVGACRVIARQTNTVAGKRIVIPEQKFVTPSDYGVFVKNARGKDGQQLDRDNPLWLQPISHFRTPFFLNLPDYLSIVFDKLCKSDMTCMGAHRGFITNRFGSTYNIYIPNLTQNYSRLDMEMISKDPAVTEMNAVTNANSLASGFPLTSKVKAKILSALNSITPSGQIYALFFYESGIYNKGDASGELPDEICNGSIDSLLGLAPDKWKNIHTIFTAPLNSEIRNAQWVIFKDKTIMITNSDFTKVLWRGKVNDVWSDLEPHATNIGSAIPYWYNNASMLALILRNGNTEYLNVNTINNVELLSTNNDLPGLCKKP